MFDRDRRNDCVHYQRAGRLSLTDQLIQNFPMPVARFENTGHRCVSHEETAAAGSAAARGCSKTRLFVLIRKNAQSSATQSGRSDPDKVTSSHCRLAWCWTARGW